VPLKKILKITWRGFCCVALLWIIALMIAPDQPPKSADTWSRAGVFISGLIVLLPLAIFIGLIDLLFGKPDPMTDQSRKEE
jgi:hypothetical protein